MNRTYGNQKRVDCPACGKVIRDLWDLGGEFHEGAKFECDYCGKECTIEVLDMPAYVTLVTDEGTSIEHLSEALRQSRARIKQLQSDLAEAINELVQQGRAMSSQGISWTMACGGGGSSGGSSGGKSKGREMQDFGMYPSNTDEVRRYSAERENATARLERAMTRECCKLLLSQHDPVHSLGIDRKDLKVLLDFVQLHHDPARLRRECEDLLANKENER